METLIYWHKGHGNPSELLCEISTNLPWDTPSSGKNMDDGRHRKKRERYHQIDYDDTVEHQPRPGGKHDPQYLTSGGSGGKIGKENSANQQQLEATSLESKSTENCKERGKALYTEIHSELDMGTVSK